MVGKCPVEFTDYDDGLWTVNNYELVSKVLGDSKVFSSAHHIDGSGRTYERDGKTLPYRGPAVPVFPVAFGLLELDGAEHRPYRRALQPLMSPVAVAKKEEHLRALVVECIDSFIESGRCDFMEDLTAPVPAIVTMEALGLSREQARPYQRVMHNMVSATPGAGREAAAQHVQAMMEEVAVVARERRENPQDDWLSFMSTVEIDGERMSEKAVLDQAAILIAGGVGTATTLVSSTLLHLHRNPADRERLIADRDLIRRSCDEFLRVYTPVNYIGRTVTGPTAIDGVELVEGDRVGIGLGAANRDPKIFKDPDELRLDRNAKKHMAFGAGIHRCIGSHLGQLEFRVIIEEVLDRLPDFSIDEAAIVRVESLSVKTFATMPAVFTPGVRSTEEAAEVTA